jgi:hypothetical protein
VRSVGDGSKTVATFGSYILVGRHRDRVNTAHPARLGLNLGNQWPVRGCSSLSDRARNESVKKIFFDK